MFTALIVEPFGWVLKLCYNLIGNYGLSIIIFSVIAKLVTLPFQMKSKKSMMDMQRLQPKLAELEKKYKDDKERYSLEVQKLYKKEGVSMFGGCLPMLIMLPIMIGLYSVVRQPLTYIFDISPEQIQALADAFAAAGAKITTQGGYMLQIDVAKNLAEYPDIVASIAPNLVNLDFNFLGINLSEIPNFRASIKPFIVSEWLLWIIPVLSGLTAWLSNWFIRRSQGKPMTEQAAATNGMMNWMMPAMSVWIAFMVPAGLGLYWIVSNILSAVQEPLLSAYYKKKAEKKEEEVK
ncbi:MAG: YidC/Oxa1 family membrane protein insertase [Oscillospiraceae bacterium]|nr:YidC/Oxa1 family membrane protein insertase [Oscillospiraceae bacterium]MBQ9986727.1 YidC/Oxa1 family membrane protein insertase [Oscillospiraceae bacterium]